MQYVRSAEDADEIVNDSFMVLWEKQEELVLDETIRPFLYTVVRNKSLNLLKKRKIEITELDNGFEVAERNPGIIENIQAKETETRIFELIEQLPPRCKSIFVLSRKEHMSNRQIAELMELSEKTVENQISIAIKFIRAGLKESKKNGMPLVIFPWLLAWLIQ